MSVPAFAELALEAAPDAIAIVDADGAIRFVNRQVLTLFGYSREELLGRSIELLVPEHFRKEHVVHRLGYIDNTRVRSMGQGLRLYGRKRDGTAFPVEISLSPIETAGAVQVAAAIRDASDRQRAEEELVAARTAAERARAAAEQARELADRANQGKSRFLATASHDLRQPLQSLALLNGILRRTISDPAPSEALLQQERAIGAMSRLLNALLDISKLESGAIKPEPTDFTVSALFEELRREFADIAAAKGLALEIELSSACAHTDRSLIAQVLRNLLANAIKYTRRGRVALRCPLAAGPTLCIEVLDTGIGIPADRLTHIYDEFYQVSVPANSPRDGYGLGLSIVKRIIELLDLKLEVRSQVDQGTSFSLHVPTADGPFAVAPDQCDETPARAQRFAPSAAPHVLLVEDDSGVREATRMLLAAEGYQVTAVESLNEAVGIAQARDVIDLVVADYHLRDGETGMQVITEVRNTLGGPVRAVLITGDTSSAIRALPQECALRTVSKPVRADDLLALLREMLSETTVRAEERLLPEPSV